MGLGSCRVGGWLVDLLCCSCDNSAWIYAWFGHGPAGCLFVPERAGDVVDVNDVGFGLHLASVLVVSEISSRLTETRVLTKLSLFPPPTPMRIPCSPNPGTHTSIPSARSGNPASLASAPCVMLRHTPSESATAPPDSVCTSGLEYPGNVYSKREVRYTRPFM